MGSAAVAFLRAYRFPLGLFAVLRVWTFVWASLVNTLGMPSEEAGKHYYGVEPLRDLIFAPWQRWDTIWYTKIAVEGYAADLRVVFPPLYPFLMRLSSPFQGGNVVAGGLLVSSIAGCAAFVLLFQMARGMFDQAAARRAILFLAAFPTAFFLFAAYTEALFLALALGAFVGARSKCWIWAGVLGGLAACTRPQGVLFVLPLAVEFWSQYRRREVSLRSVWTLAIVGLGGAVQILWLTLQFGSPGVWFNAESVWHRAVLPWDVLREAWSAVLFAPSLTDAFVSFWDPFFAVVFLLTLVVSARRLPLSFTMYLAIVVLPPLFVATTYSPHYPLTAMARYVMVGFPFFLLVGSLPKSWWQLPTLAISFLVQTFWLMLFVAWVFVH